MKSEPTFKLSSSKQITYSGRNDCFDTKKAYIIPTCIDGDKKKSAAQLEEQEEFDEESLQKELAELIDDDLQNASSENEENSSNEENAGSSGSWEDLSDEGDSYEDKNSSTERKTRSSESEEASSDAEKCNEKALKEEVLNSNDKSADYATAQDQRTKHEIELESNREKEDQVLESSHLDEGKKSKVINSQENADKLNNQSDSENGNKTDYGNNLRNQRRLRNRSKSKNRNNLNAGKSPSVETGSQHGENFQDRSRIHDVEKRKSEEKGDMKK